MIEFLTGALATTAKIRHLVETSQHVRLAVAFWGRDAARDLGLEKRAVSRSTELICNLSSGGTNPDEIKKLIDFGINVKQCDTLHGKVYLFDRSFVMGSSNASANGLALQGKEVSYWHEANILSDEREIHKKLSGWIDALPTKEITKRDLAAAKIKFNRHRQVMTNSNPWPLHTDLFSALAGWPECFRDQNIFITWYSEDLNLHQQEDVNKESRQQENISLDVSGVGFELKPSSSYVGFWLDEKSRRVTSGGFFCTKDREWTNKKKRNKVWFCENVNNIRGVKNRGSMQAWSKALLAADADMQIGTIPTDSIEIGDFFERYIREDSALADAVTKV
jgi:hypothetical protein